MGFIERNQLLHTKTAPFLARNIVALMKKRRISDSDLAKAISLPYNTIKRITVGKTVDPKISTLLLIANFFDVSIDGLLKNMT